MTAWRTLAASVPGAAHQRHGLPSQDAARVARCHSQALPLILALADGHGSRRCMRSRRGARVAVAVAHLIRGHLADRTSLSRIKRWAEEQLPLELVRHWQGRVERLVARQPFAEDELAPLDASDRRALEINPQIAYGTTLLAVVIAPSFILYLQLGDGDILTVSSDGVVARPVARDERLIANETTSLCSPQAWNEMRVVFQGLAGAPPSLILAASDGYANSFRNDLGFRQVARDLWTMIREEGWASVRPRIKDWLSEASELGSGDDISVVLASRIEAEPLSDAHQLDLDLDS